MHPLTRRKQPGTISPSLQASIATLHKVADYFDVAVWVEFVPFSTLLERTSDLSAEALTPANYSEEFGDDEQPNTPLR